MGLIYASIELDNPGDNGIKKVQVDNALVDTGAVHLCIPEELQIQLGLKEVYKREIRTADGKSHLVPYVGPVEITFENRACMTGALVLGDEVLLGAIPMEDMDLVLNPMQQEVTVNPKSPNVPMAIVKDVR